MCEFFDGSVLMVALVPLIHVFLGCYGDSDNEGQTDGMNAGKGAMWALLVVFLVAGCFSLAARDAAPASQHPGTHLLAQVRRHAAEIGKRQKNIMVIGCLLVPLFFALGFVAWGKSFAM